MKESTVFRSW